MHVVDAREMRLKSLMRLRSSLTSVGRVSMVT
jgi:hypothetical protein